MTSHVRVHFLPKVLGIIAICLFTGIADAQVHVRGYYRKDGTYVRSHYRSNPDGRFENNWSTKGNINPYTGEWGTRVTPPSRTGSSTAGRSYSSHYSGGYTPEYEGPAWIQNPHYSDPVPSLQTAANDAMDERLRDVAAFSYHGIGFATTHTEFLRRYPHARPAVAPTPDGVVSYAMDDVDRQRDAVWFQFVGEDLMCLGFTYDAPLVRSCGGASTLLMHSKLRFGEPTAEDEAVTVWRYPTIDRTIRAGWSGDDWCLLVSRDTVQEGVRSRNAEIGPDEDESLADATVHEEDEADAETSGLGNSSS